MYNFTAIILATVYAITMISLIAAIAFFTVLERKVLASIQRRRGPNVVGVWGLLQAIADGIKLLLKEPVVVSGANYYIFLIAPVFLLATSLTLWSVIPLMGFVFGVGNNYSFIVVILFSGLNSYAIILAGLASNSRYSLIGGVRAIAQMISYEVPLAVSLLTLSCLQGGFDLRNFALSNVLYIFIALPVLVILFISLLAETNRTPFDLPEAEAELVAGYNLEYSSILFSLFFLAEYSNILVAASVISILFFNWCFYLSVIVFSILIVVARAILPRYTFAQLIKLCWCTLFPVSIFLFFVSVSLIWALGGGNNNLIDVNIIEALQSTGDRARSLFLFATPASILQGGISARALRRYAAALARPVECAFLSGAADVHMQVGTALKLTVFFVAAAALVIGLVAANWIAVNFKSNNRKNSPYECGFEPLGSPVSDFSPNFLSIALVFLIYDVEVLLTFPWAYGMYGQSFGALVSLAAFIAIMFVGFIYEVLDDTFCVV